MSPADHAAYAALGLAPGAPWPLVHAAWRDLVKRHHPDANTAGSSDDARRLREANAAYTHLCRREAIVHAAPGRLIARRRGEITRRTLWDLIWDPRAWGTWMPGVQHAEKVTGTCDQRRAVGGTWGGHRFRATIVLTSVTPPCRLAGRVLELLIDGRAVDLGVPPRVFARLDVVGRLTEVELGLVLPTGQPLPPVLQAALQAALVELLDLASPLALPAPVEELEDQWRDAA